VIDRLPVPTQGGVVAGERIALTSPASTAKYEQGRPLRRVEVVTPEGNGSCL
jgi:hypothetical protein